MTQVQGLHAVLQNDTFIESSNKDSDVVAVPSLVEFDVLPNKKSKFIVKLVNRGGTVIRTRIIPPTSHEFVIKYEKKGLFAPGSEIPILVTFKPSENRYHEDRICVQVEGSSNLVIPLKASPSLPQIKIPDKINFGLVPIAGEQSKTYTLFNSGTMELKFNIDTSQLSTFQDDVTIIPDRGCLKPGEETDIIMTYQPTRYATVSTSIFFSLAYVGMRSSKTKHLIFGQCKQGLAASTKYQDDQEDDGIHVTRTFEASETLKIKHRDSEGPSKVLESSSSPPRSAKHQIKDTAKRTKSRPMTSRIKKKPDLLQEVANDAHGLQLPSSIVGMAAVNKVLNQHVTHLGANLPSVLQGDRSLQQMHLRRHALESTFLQMRKKLMTSSSGKGHPSLSHDERRHVLSERRIHEQDFATLTGIGSDYESQAFEYHNIDQESSPSYRYMRFLDEREPACSRNIDLEYPDFLPKPSLNLRHRLQRFERFRQIVRKVIIRNRADLRLKQLRHHFDDNLKKRDSKVSIREMQESDVHFNSKPARLIIPTLKDRTTISNETQDTYLEPELNPPELTLLPLETETTTSIPFDAAFSQPSNNNVFISPSGTLIDLEWGFKELMKGPATRFGQRKTEESTSPRSSRASSSKSRSSMRKSISSPASRRKSSVSRSKLAQIDSRRASSARIDRSTLKVSGDMRSAISADDLSNLGDS